MAELPWPLEIGFIRHGESAGNPARDAAEQTRLPRIDSQSSNPDAPLSTLGEQRSKAPGSGFPRLPPDVS